MFSAAIEKVAGFTRPIYTIRRRYPDNTIIKDCGTMFFVNDRGTALTAKHVASTFPAAEQLDKKYKEFLAERSRLKHDATFQFEEKLLAKRYGFTKDSITQVCNSFVNCVQGEKGFTITAHPKYDLALIQFNAPGKYLYYGHAVFAKSAPKVGTSVCRLSYPFPEFTNYRFNEEQDRIEFTQEGKTATPYFPVDGMITRYLSDSDRLFAIETSTPGMLGNSGGPMFDRNGVVCGMQFAIATIRQTINAPNRKDASGNPVEAQTFEYRLGNCIHVDVIKDFLRANGVTFTEE
ncbi:MAG: trypsin-like peptidase domain-containing protein [Clostridia bacterium]|nr:trypsin-like peptidase domain-containing protein [Clostridia bacterium]